MMDLGMVRPGETLDIPFSTYDSNDPSASVTVTGLAATDIEIYKDGSLTQRASDSGYVVDTDLDTIVGVHSIQIDLADNGTAGFFSAGSKYVVAVASITVDGATINFVLARFSIGYPAATLNTTIATLASQTSFTLTKGPAEADALKGMWCIIHDVASEVQLGHAVISAYDVTTKTVTLAAGTTFTAAATDNISIMGLAPLQPTTPGATLDVTAGDVTLADGPHGGTAAVLTLERFVAASTTTNQPAMKLTGDGSAAGLTTTGGVTGAGLLAQGGSTSGNGIAAQAHASASSGAGLACVGRGASPGLQGLGGLTGVGIEGQGGATSGHGIRGIAVAGNSHGVTLVKDGTGKDIDADEIDAIKTVTDTQTAITPAALVDLVWDEVLTGAAHNVTNSSGRRLRQLQERGVYQDGAVWIDTVNGTAGTEDFENGTSFNPVDNLADALTLATSVGLARFRVAPGSSLTFASTLTNKQFVGSSWSLALGGQEITGTLIIGAEVSGTALMATGHADFASCDMGICTLGAFELLACGLENKLTLSAAANYHFSQCFHHAASGTSVIIDMGAAILNTVVHMHHHSGPVEIENLGQAGTDTVIYEGFGALTLNVNCVGGTVNIRGNITLTNNGSGMTINDDARIDTGQVNTEVADVLKTDTIAEMAQQAPPTTPTFEEAVMYLYMAITHKIDITASVKEFHNNAGTIIWKKALSDDATTYTEAESASGP